MDLTAIIDEILTEQKQDQERDEEDCCCTIWYDICPLAEESLEPELNLRCVL